jgi:hypothetical protein
MRPDGNTAGLVDELNTIASGEQIRWQERGSLITDESLKGFPDRLHMAVKREGASQVGATDHARARLRNFDHIIQREPHAIRLQPIEHAADAIAAFLRCGGGVSGELLVSVIDEIAEDVLLTTV